MLIQHLITSDLSAPILFLPKLQFCAFSLRLRFIQNSMLKMASPPPQGLLCNLLVGLFMFLNTSTSAPCLPPPPPRPRPESVRWKSVSPRLVSASPSSHSEDITLSADTTVTQLDKRLDRKLVVQHSSLS